MRLVIVLALLLFARLGYSRELTDIWWLPEESGWGVNTVHEGNSLILTLFVHAQSHRPQWYSAALTRYGNTQDGDPEFVGDLYETSGSPAQGPWSPNDVSSRRVGLVYFKARPDGQAELEYELDGVTVIKNIVRFTQQADRLEGLHYATLLPGYDSCETGFQGLRVFERGVLSIERCASGACTGVAAADRGHLNMLLVDNGREICSIEGAFTRYGNSGGIRGNYVCADGGQGAIAFKNIEFTSVGFSARFTAEHPRCQTFSGILTGVRTSAR